MEMENTSTKTQNLTMSALLDGKMATVGLCGTKLFCPKQLKSKRNIESKQKKMLERARTLCHQGLFGKAAKFFFSDGLAPSNEKTYKDLCSLRPKEKAESTGY